MGMIATSVEPVWIDAVESGIVEYRNVYTGDRGTVEDVTFFAYATPRRANDELVHRLRARNIQALVVGDDQLETKRMVQCERRSVFAVPNHGDRLLPAAGAVTLDES
jgi:hypothetical protein